VPTVARAQALVSWSSGKDSAFALHEARRELDIVGLLTTVTAEFDRVSMHGVRRELLVRQAEAVGLPCTIVEIPSPCPNEVYERAMATALADAQAQGITHVVFGDLFLADIRAYREAKLASVGMHGVFPLWGRDTKQLAAEMIDAGLRATITCIDPRQLDRSFAGRVFDDSLLRDLPPDVDPCGEHGEFHTFATHGPMFRTPIATQVGDIVERDGFVFADLR
jgi:uncharacterized protein (TIGR00290 family)